MNKFLIIICFGLFTNSTISQEHIKLVYTSSTEKSLEELENLTANNKLEYKSALVKYNELEGKGKVILSSNEYAPIKKIIKNYNSGQTLNQEEKLFAEEAINKYISITDIITK
jgi:hypothetical protein